MEKINIAELLKDCPEGMELDCTMFDDVTFVRVDNNREQFPIEIAVGGLRSKYLTKEGCFHDNTLITEAKCVIFPKGKTTWEGFVPPCKFKDGVISHKMREEVDNLKTEYKNKFGSDYDKEVDEINKAYAEKVKKERLLEEVWEACTFDEIIDAGFELNKCSSQHLLDAAEEFVIKQEEDKDFIDSLNELCEKTAKSKLPWAHEVMMILCDYFNEYDLMDYFDNDDLIEHLDGTWEMDNYINNKEIDAVNDYKVCNPDFTIEECIQYLSDVPFYNLRRYFCDLTSNCYYCSDEQLIKDIKNKLNIK